MNPDNFIALLHEGFLVTVGAGASLIEILQDPEQRGENFSKLRTDLDQLVQELAEKGKITEQEARNFVDHILIKQEDAQTVDAASEGSVPTDSSASDLHTEQELRELTAQIAALRAELEKLRD